MLDAHAHVMQVKLCKPNTRGVTSYINSVTCFCSLLGLAGSTTIKPLPAHVIHTSMVAGLQPSKA